MRLGVLLGACALAIIFFATDARAQESAAYQYDSLGRLVTSSITAGVNSGVATRTCFDAAHNRTYYGVVLSGAAICPPPPNHAPVAVADVFSMTCHIGGGRNVLTNDTDADGNTLTLVSVTSNGGITMSVGSPAGIVAIGAGNTGFYSGTYVVSDGVGGTATGTINVTVTSPGPGC
jgi:hypothetical protein